MFESQKKASRFLSLLLVLCTVAALTACGDEGASSNTSSAVSSRDEMDVIEQAVSLSSFGKNGLTRLKTRTKGSGLLPDAVSLQSNPLELAQYTVRDHKNLPAPAEGLSSAAEFHRYLVTQKGFLAKFSALQPAQPSQDAAQALEQLYDFCGSQKGKEKAQRQMAKLPAAVQNALAQYLSALLPALKTHTAWTDSVSKEQKKQLHGFVFCTPAQGNTDSDYAALQLAGQLHSTVSESTRLQVAQTLLTAAAQLQKKLQAQPHLTADGAALCIDTPIGQIVLGSEHNDTYRSPDAFLLIDPAGDDTYHGRIACGSALHQVFSTVIDLSGNDTYTATKQDGPTQGSGILGVGILADLSGNDTYTAERASQGFGLLGAGILYDGGGDDVYKGRVSVQAAAHYGVALCMDAAGNDTYEAAGYAQASAGPRSTAYLVDGSGNDCYTVQSLKQDDYPDLVYGQFESAGVNGNWSQACGWGQRVLNVSGGLAGILDLQGNDRYTGGIWVQGTGYWSGIGSLYDLQGNDVYQSLYYSQASVAHCGYGILLDGAGNDSHILLSSLIETGASLSFVWDSGHTILINDGGNDRYHVSVHSIGVAWGAYEKVPIDQQESHFALFLETAGDDIYSTVKNEYHYGTGRGGFFVDGGGDDFHGNSLKNNSTDNSAKRQGGVFIDHDDTVAPASFPFWETALKAK